MLERGAQHTACFVRLSSEMNSPSAVVSVIPGGHQGQVRRQGTCQAVVQDTLGAGLQSVRVRPVFSLSCRKVSRWFLGNRVQRISKQGPRPGSRPQACVPAPRLTSTWPPSSQTPALAVWTEPPSPRRASPLSCVCLWTLASCWKILSTESESISTLIYKCGKMRAL